MLKSPKNNIDYVVYEQRDLLYCSFKKLFSPKDELIIELETDEIFHGEFLEGGEHRIDITNITQIHTDSKIKGILTFYQSEIRRIKHVKHKNVQESINKTDDHKTHNIKLDKDEYFRLKDMINQYIYIEDLCLSNPIYCDAIKALNCVENIGVAAPGILKREPFIPLLVLSTWKQIFIFDTSQLKPNYFLPKMKDIFESDFVCKIIHKGAPLSDILQRYYHVYPKNVFDTDVVDLIIQKNSNTHNEIIHYKNVFECLEVYLNFPSTLNENFKVKPNKWAKRPVKESKMVYASQLVVYLISLKEALYDLLINKLHNTTDAFCDYYSSMSKNPYDFAEKFKLKELSSDMESLIDNVSSFSLE